MSEQNQGSKNVIVANLWKTKNGHYNSMPTDDKNIEALKQVTVGGKFLIRNRTQTAIDSAKNPETAPVAYLEFVPAEAVIEFNAAKAARNTGL